MSTPKSITIVIPARNEEALKSVCDDLTAKGARCAYIVADVGVREQVKAVAEFAVGEFGAFDTWVNNAGVTVIGPLLDTPIDDQRRLFDAEIPRDAFEIEIRKLVLAVASDA